MVRRTFFHLFCIGGVLLITAHRLPAPISEVQETPSPTPAVAPAPQPKKSPPQPKSKPTGATRFAGTWIGKMNIMKNGDVDFTFVISAEGTSVLQNSKIGEWTRPLTYDGKLLSWQTGPTNKVAWTLMLNPDEQSALVTRTFSETQSKAIFKRVQGH